HNIVKAYSYVHEDLLGLEEIMMKAEEKFSPGLDGVVAAETKISFLDTVKGEIVIQVLLFHPHSVDVLPIKGAQCLSTLLFLRVRLNHTLELQFHLSLWQRRRRFRFLTQ
ncbi:hypothetical protein ACT453_37615, partial [Bacillus sp. D-CC]